MCTNAIDCKGFHNIINGGRPLLNPEVLGSAARRAAIDARVETLVHPTAFSRDTVDIDELIARATGQSDADVRLKPRVFRQCEIGCKNIRGCCPEDREEIPKISDIQLAPTIARRDVLASRSTEAPKESSTSRVETKPAFRKIRPCEIGCASINGCCGDNKNPLLNPITNSIDPLPLAQREASAEPPKESSTPRVDWKTAFKGIRPCEIGCASINGCCGENNMNPLLNTVQLAQRDVDELVARAVLDQVLSARGLAMQGLD